MMMRYVRVNSGSQDFRSSAMLRYIFSLPCRARPCICPSKEMAEHMPGMKQPMPCMTELMLGMGEVMALLCESKCAMAVHCAPQGS